MGQPFPDDAVGGTTLIRPAIKSPNYDSGVSGWTINQDGTAEFADLTVRGKIIVEDADDGVFVYAYIEG
jgi:hypothetical protein